MKRIFTFPIFVLVFSVATFAQIDKNSTCPTLSITGPAGIVAPNDSATYTANIDTKGKELNLEYIWSITAGEILEGQGTKILKVKQPEFNNLTVTIKVKGFPKECPNTASESAVVSNDYLVSIKIDEFSIVSTRIDKARLDYLILELQNNANAVAYIIEKFEPKISANQRKLKMRKLSDYLFRTNKIKKNKIVIRYANANETLTQFFIVPAGATPPDCEGCYI